MRRIYNGKGDYVGYIDKDVYTNDLAYYTDRDAREGQIFLYKKDFDGVHMNIPVAIDKDILIRLIYGGVKHCIFTIQGIERQSYSVRSSATDIFENAVVINYDKTRPKRTWYRTQYVFDITRYPRVNMPLKQALIHTR